jgi:RNA 3'-terminal phosphate cyclase
MTVTLQGNGSNLRFEGSSFFRQRIVMATLTRKMIRIDRIRSNDENPGLRGLLKRFVLFRLRSFFFEINGKSY